MGAMPQETACEFFDGKLGIAVFDAGVLFKILKKGGYRPAYRFSNGADDIDRSAFPDDSIVDNSNIGPARLVFGNIVTVNRRAGPN